VEVFWGTIPFGEVNEKKVNFSYVGENSGANSFCGVENDGGGGLTDNWRDLLINRAKPPPWWSWRYLSRTW
jgi:hypothetical protein